MYCVDPAETNRAPRTASTAVLPATREAIVRSGRHAHFHLIKEELLGKCQVHLEGDCLEK